MLLLICFCCFDLWCIVVLLLWFDCVRFLCDCGLLLGCLCLLFLLFAMFTLVDFHLYVCNCFGVFM